MGCSDFGAEISVEILELDEKEYGLWCRIPFSNSEDNEEQVLTAIKSIHQMGRPVCLEITGAVTVLMEAMGSLEMIRCYRKQEKDFWIKLNQIVNDLALYAQKVLELGVEMISYGDPSGNLKIMGPDFFHKVTGVVTRKFYEQVKEIHQGCVFHLCPQLTAALMQDHQIILAENREKNATYGESLLELLKEGSQIWLTGNRCIKQEESIVSSIPIYQWSSCN